MCALSLSSPSAFRRTGKHEELAGDVAVDHIWTRSQVTAPVHVLVALVSVYVQCTLIWKYIKCMRILTTRILFACCHVISTIFGMKLTAR